MTSTTATPRTGAARSSFDLAGRVDAMSPRARKGIGWALLALLAYVPVLLTWPGKVAADTKQYLYLDPARLMSRAWSMWDPNVGMGTVTHQNIGYLFPMGPFYWLWERIGAPDWVAQRLWLGSILFFAGAGMLYLFRTLRLTGPGAVVGALAYMLSPYSLDYAARISVILLPWAGLPFMLAFLIRGLRQGGWRYPAAFAITVQVVGSVNATALVFAGIAPVMWIPFAIWVLHETTWRRALATVAKIALLSLLASLWWISGLWAQGSYGLNVLEFTETLYAVSRTALAGEVLRGLGYWFFYGRDKLGPWIEASENYTQSPVLILVSYGIPVLAMVSAAVVRWTYRTYFILVALVGVVIAVGAHPYESPTPLGGVFKSLASSSTAAFALRSTGRATPLVLLGLAALLAAGVNALARALRERGQPTRALLVSGLVGVLVVANLPALWNGTFYGENLQRDEAIPQYWQDAIAYLDERPADTRIFEIPGADFASYRWGNTVDPITPGLTDRPFVARELIPYGSDASADLLNAVDRRINAREVDPDGIAPVARLMSVGDILLRNDIQWERYRLIRPRFLWDIFNPTPQGLTGPVEFGETVSTANERFPFDDEQQLAAPDDLADPPALAAYSVDHTSPILRSESASRPVIVSGDGEGVVDAGAAGLLTPGGVVLYSAAFGADDAALRAQVERDATLVVTDTNRPRARRWSTVYDNLGATEGPGQEALKEDLSDARLEVFPDAPESAFTVTDQRGVRSIQASSYGNPISFTPENRGVRAFDGDLDTSWITGAFDNVHGERIRVELDEPVTNDSIRLVQPQRGDRDRWITEVNLRFDDGDPIRVALGPDSRTKRGEAVQFPRRSFRSVDIEVAQTNLGRLTNYAGTSAVGFAEIGVADEAPGSKPARANEVFVMPTDLVDAAGPAAASRPLVYLMRRERVYPVPPRYDPELDLVRQFSVPDAREFAMGGQVRIASTADDDILDRLLGYTGDVRATSSDNLPSSPANRASAAVDGDPSTAWVTRFRGIKRQWVEVAVPDPITVDRLDLEVVADGLHSVPTKIEISNEDGDARVVDLPAIADQPARDAATPVPVTFDPLTGREMRVRILEAREVPTFEFYCECYVALPAAIAELGIPGVPPITVATTLPDVCRTDLVSIDGAPVPVRVTGTTAAALALEPLGVEACDGSGSVTVDLAAGDHVLATATGGEYGLDVDRVVLASSADGAPWAVSASAQVDPAASGLGGPAPAAPKTEIVRRGRVRSEVEVTDATAPFWVVMGQSKNAGWRATVNGRELGESTLVDGFANGWLIRPAADGAPLRIVVEWVPERTVLRSIAISVVTVVVCLAIVITSMVLRRRRRRRAEAAGEELADPLDGAGDPSPRLVSPFSAPGHAPSRLAIAAATAVTTLVAGFIVAPWVGLVTGAAVLLVLLRPRLWVAFVVFPALALAATGGYIALKQLWFRIIPTFEWPTFFWQVRTLGWLSIVFLAAGAVVELARTTRRSRPPEP